jgi:hypothetical protein
MHRFHVRFQFRLEHLKAAGGFEAQVRNFSKDNRADILIGAWNGLDPTYA